MILVKKNISSILLLMAAIFLFSFSCTSQSTEHTLSDSTALYKKLIVGKWRNDKMMVMGKEVKIPEEGSYYDIYKEDGTLERGNEEYGYQTGRYEIKDGNIIMGGTFKIEKLTEEDFIFSMVTEQGEVKQCLKRVKQ